MVFYSSNRKEANTQIHLCRICLSPWLGIKHLNRLLTWLLLSSDPNIGIHGLDATKAVFVSKSPIDSALWAICLLLSSATKHPDATSQTQGLVFFQNKQDWWLYRRPYLTFWKWHLSRCHQERDFCKARSQWSLLALTASGWARYYFGT